MDKQQIFDMNEFGNAGDSVSQMFLQNRQVVERIIMAAGATLEKHAMNHAPSGEEMQQMQGRMEEITENLTTLERQAQEQIQAFEAEQNALTRQCDMLIREREKLFARLDEVGERRSDLLIQLAREEALLREQEYLCMQAVEERDRLEEEVRRVEAEARKREKELKKWCWVPGYNVYLAVDTLVKDYNSRIEKAVKNCKEKQQEYEKREFVLREIQNRLNEIESELERCKNEINAKIEEIQKITAMLEETKKELIRWDNVRIRLGKLKSKMSAGAVSPDTLLEVLVTMDEYSENKAK